MSPRSRHRSLLALALLALALGASAAASACEPFGCPDGQVDTTDGCLSCLDAADRMQRAIEQVRSVRAACSTSAECSLVPADNACLAGCPAAVSDPEGFAADLQAVSDDYCRPGYVTTCGFGNLDCFGAAAACRTGQCVTLTR